MSALAFTTRIYPRDNIVKIMQRSDIRTPLGLRQLQLRGREVELDAVLEKAGITPPKKPPPGLKIRIRDNRLNKKIALEILQRKDLREMLGPPALAPKLGIQPTTLDSVINSAKEYKSLEVDAMTADFILSHDVHVEPSNIYQALKALARLESEAKEVTAEAGKGQEAELKDFYQEIRLHLAAAYVNIASRQEQTVPPLLKIVGRLDRNIVKQATAAGEIVKLLSENLDQRVILIFDTMFAAAPDQPHELGTFAGTAIVALAEQENLSGLALRYITGILTLAYETKKGFKAFQAGQLAGAAARILFQDNTETCFFLNGINQKLEHDDTQFFNGAMGVKS